MSANRLQALVFDFDGLITDTESLDYMIWQEEFLRRGAELDLEGWLQGIGGGPGSWSPTDHLAARLGRPVDSDEVWESVRARHHELAPGLTPREGIVEWLDFLGAEGIPYGIASSSKLDWVEWHLECIGLRSRYEVIVTSDQVTRAKPWPDLYLEACRRLGSEPAKTAAFEDSINGIRAARSAGLFAVAVPNPVTRAMAFDEACLVVSSPAAIDWPGLQEAFASALEAEDRRRSSE